MTVEGTVESLSHEAASCAGDPLESLVNADTISTTQPLLCARNQHFIATNMTGSCWVGFALQNAMDIFPLPLNDQS